MGPHGRNRRVIEFSLCRPPSRPLARAAGRARDACAAPRPTHSLVDFLILVNTIKIDPARSSLSSFHCRGCSHSSINNQSLTSAATFPSPLHQHPTPGEKNRTHLTVTSACGFPFPKAPHQSSENSQRATQDFVVWFRSTNVDTGWAAVGTEAKEERAIEE